jgi:hypothetical protein
MDLFSFLSFHFICVTVTVVTGHSVALCRRSHLFSMMSSLHDVLVHNKQFPPQPPLRCPWRCLHARQMVPLYSRAEMVATCVPRDGCLCVPPVRVSRVVEAPSTSRLQGATAQASPLLVKNRPPPL